MDRRTFMKLSAATAAGVAVPSTVASVTAGQAAGAPPAYGRYERLVPEIFRPVAVSVMNSR